MEKSKHRKGEAFPHCAAASRQIARKETIDLPELNYQRPKTKDQRPKTKDQSTKYKDQSSFFRT
jgi:hypothetical protein